MKIIKEICEKYDGALEFIINRFTELCSQERALIDEVRTWFKTNLFLLSSLYQNSFLF